MLQYVAVCCTKAVADAANLIFGVRLSSAAAFSRSSVKNPCFAVRCNGCSVLQCVAVCCSVLRCVAVCCSVLQCVRVCCSVLRCVAVCCSVLQCVRVSCSVLRCVVG